MRILLALLLLGCRGEPVARGEHGQASPAGGEVQQAASAAPVTTKATKKAEASLPATRLAPLAADWLVRLGEPPHEIVVTPPVGATEPRRVVIGVHGAGDRPDWACGGWRLISGATTFVVCPAGTWSRQGWYAWASTGAMEQSIDAALALARQRFGKYVADGPAIYAGFSQGAILAEPILRRRAAELPIAILAEGGLGFATSSDFARAYQRAGGRRIALVCGNPACFVTAKNAQKVLERAGIEALVLGDPQAGHNLNGRMQTAVASAWAAISAPL